MVLGLKARAPVPSSPWTPAQSPGLPEHRRKTVGGTPQPVRTWNDMRANKGNLAGNSGPDPPSNPASCEVRPT